MLYIQIYSLNIVAHLVIYVGFAYLINPFVPSGLFYHNSLNRSIVYISGVWLVFIKELSRFNANNVDPDQTPRSVASDLGLRCLPMSLLWDARLNGLHFMK